MSRYVQPAPHEGDAHLIYTQHGLDPYYAMDSVYKEHDWRNDGKPAATIDHDGTEWAVCFDYYQGGLDPWENPQFQIETVREFQFYFVAKDSPHYSGERADHDDRVRGGTVTVRPRWPDLKSDGQPVSVPDYGVPYVDVQVQAANIAHDKYESLATAVMGAFDVSPRYFMDHHQDSNWNDLAYYVRIKRDESGPLIGADGPISRTHQVLESDRSGYRKHVEDNRKLPGYYVTTTIPDTRARELIRGHDLGKEVKHYYPNHPENYEPGEAPYHPKLEVSYMTSVTDDTVYYDDLEAARRELADTVINYLHWSGLPTAIDNESFVQFDPYWSAEDSTEARKLTDCPLPEIEDQQQAQVMRLWGDMTEADRDVTEYLLTDGGEVSPHDAADATGYSYRTIREVMSRCEDIIEHQYGEMAIASEKVAQELTQRVRAAGEAFEQAVGGTLMQAANDATDHAQTAWGKWRARYAVDVDDDPQEPCWKMLRTGYKPADRSEAAEIIREGIMKLEQERTAKMQRLAKAKVQLQDGRRITFHSLNFHDLKIS